jgi:hypothetical protein
MGPLSCNVHFSANFIAWLVSLLFTFNSTLPTTTPDTCMLDEAHRAMHSPSNVTNAPGSFRFGYVVRQNLDHLPQLLIDPDYRNCDTTQGKQNVTIDDFPCFPNFVPFSSYLLLPCFSELHHRRHLHQGHRCVSSADL